MQNGLNENAGFGVTQAVVRAIAFAAEKHRKQRRRDVDRTPYINHPIALANVLANESCVADADVLVAAILHDTIEDTETTADELTATFGPRVCGLVLEVTDDKALAPAARKQLQIDHSGSRSEGAKRIKLADKICNLRDISQRPPSTWSVERRCEYYDWAKKVIDGLRGVDARLESLFDAEYAKRPGN